MGIYESILGSERETRKSAFDIIHFAKKLTFAGLKKYSIVQERFEKKSTLWGGGEGVISTGREKMQNYDIYKT